jgi:glycosyltransferase involved in cell wall biosynthesis
MKLSIIIPTLDRFTKLKQCLKSIERFKPTVDYEIIVIDGGSIDGTKEWLHFQQDLIVIQHNARLGCVKAFNDGFWISRGEYVAQLSDDVRIRDDCLDAACAMLDERHDLGQIVIRHCQGGRMQGPLFQTDHGKFLFAAFGVTRKWLGDKVGWWGDYHHQYGDPELSIKIYNTGLGVEILPEKSLLHYPGKSAMRNHNADRLLFHERWHDWKKWDGRRNSDV